MEIKFPENLPDSKKINYINIIDKSYDKIVILIHKLGNVCMLDQFIRLYKMSNKNLTETYAKVKAVKIIKEMEKLNLINTKNINKYKIIYLKKFAFLFIYNNYNFNNYYRPNIALNNSNFKRHIMTVEYYLKYKEVITLKNLDSELLRITNDILSIVKSRTNLKGYDIKLIENILSEGSADKYIEEIEKLPSDNLLRIIWIDFKKIYHVLRLQNQTITKQPLYYKFFIRNNTLLLHYIPNIIIFDTHNATYYNKKLNSLFNIFFSIPSNHTLDLRNNYLQNKTLGFKGFNHFAYAITLVGSDGLNLKATKEYLTTKINDNPNGLITNIDAIQIDISKYFKEKSQKIYALEKIDDEFDKLISLK